MFRKDSFVLFTGDSITDAGRKRPIGEGLWDGLGNGYVRQIDTILQVIYPELNLRITNTGCSGNTSKDLLARFDTDVIALQPDYLYILIGTNDVWRMFDEPSLKHNQVMPDEYESNLRVMIEKTKKETKAELTLLTPFYMETNPNDLMRIKILEYAEIVKKLAKEYQLNCVELQPAFDEYLQHRYPAYISWDRVHPGQYGGLLITKEILKNRGFDKPII